MGVGVKAISSVSKVIKHEINIINSSRRAAQIAKGLYPEVKGASSKIFIKKLSKEVGPEPVVGFLAARFTNPIPGLGLLGYGAGRVVAECRKLIVSHVKKIIK